MSDKLRRDARLNRARILAVAQRRVETGGDDVPLNLIAAEAGVGVGTVYRHFPTQLDLLAAVVDPAVVDLRATLEEIVEEGGSGTIEKAFRAAVRLFAERREALLVVSSGQKSQHGASGSLEAVAALLRQMLDDAVLAGHVRPEVTVDVLQHLVCAVDYAARLASDPESARGIHTEIALRGIRPTCSQAH